MSPTARESQLQPRLRNPLPQRGRPAHPRPRHPAYLRLPPGRPRRTPARRDAHLRHSQISMTMDVYTQIPSPETRKALDRLNQSLDDSES